MSTSRTALDIVLNTDAVLTADASSSQVHRSLEYVPGRTLLGVAASRLYADLSAEDAFTVFHSGKVRFGDGIPVLDSRSPCGPTPLSFHREKLHPEGAVHNLAHPECRRLDQPRQQRSGHVDGEGRTVPPVVHHTRAQVALAAGHDLQPLHEQ